MKRLLELTLAGIVASIALSCGDKLAEPMAEILIDAGKNLVDAGTAMLDAGGSEGTRDGASDDAATTGDASMRDDASAPPRMDSGPVSGAAAQSTCQSCVIAEPIEVQAPIRVITADTDIAQLRSGFLSSDLAWQELIAGPFVITGVQPIATGAGSTANRYLELAIAQPGQCQTSSTPLVYTQNDSWVSGGASAAATFNGTLMGARYPVPAGSVLCGHGSGYWSGFVTY